MDFKDRLKQLRLSRELMQKDLGVILGVSHTAISKYELGLLEPNLRTIKKLSDYFDVSTDYLLGKTDNKSTISQDVSSKEMLDVGIKSLEIFKDSSIVDFTTDELREIIEITERVKKRKGK